MKSVVKDIYKYSVERKVNDSNVISTRILHVCIYLPEQLLTCIWQAHNFAVL